MFAVLHFAAMLTGCPWSGPYVYWLSAVHFYSVADLLCCIFAAMVTGCLLSDPYVNQLSVLDLVSGSSAVLHFCCRVNWLPVVGSLC